MILEIKVYLNTLRACHDNLDIGIHQYRINITYLSIWADFILHKSWDVG